MTISFAEANGLAGGMGYSEFRGILGRAAAITSGSDKGSLFLSTASLCGKCGVFVGEIYKFRDRKGIIIEIYHFASLEASVP